MSSIGTGRAREEALRKYRAALSANAPEWRSLQRDFIAADEIHQDYLQAERDDARRDAEEQ